MVSKKNEYAFTKMPWGKYKGCFLSELPDDYIIWAANNWSDRGTRTMFLVELERRKASSKPKAKPKDTVNNSGS